MANKNTEEDWDEYDAWTQSHLCHHCQSLVQRKWEDEIARKYDSHEAWWYNPLQKSQKFKDSLPRFVQILFD
jgi:hypothetical protein